MISTRQLRTRIRSVKNTRQITKAMQLVAASKMRRAQEATQLTRNYAEVARELLTYLSSLVDTRRDPLYAKRPLKNRLIILITADRGMAGAYNANLLKQYVELLRQDAKRGVTNTTITIGRKGSHFVARLENVESLGAYHDFPERPTGSELKPIIATLVAMFKQGQADAVDVIYTKFAGGLNSCPVTQPLLPAGFEPSAKVGEDIRHSGFEPSARAVLRGATVRLVEAQLFQALLDANAAEQSMRVIAMQNATDNASDLIDDLTLEMNKSRQAAITQELAEISGGAEAMKV
ncbi:MAG: ATP synthase F1 subunit gamma [Candidatus Chaera renei]|uniref:ATP synthase gamma chain n=1 Tax=Candidatus Chaera renei TaxID=2506947 RepID=A0A4Q0AII9_9BACT|nr:MAG: ATP synthase F1 subunit gamma [Candidatus Chaera renei]